MRLLVAPSRVPALVLLSFWVLLQAASGAVQSVSVSIIGSGSVTRNPMLEAYPRGSVVTLTAHPATDWEFVGWQGSTNSELNPLNLTLESDKTITATFQLKPRYSVSIGVEGEGTVSVPSGEYVAGTQLSLAAQPGLSWKFAGWNGGIASNQNPLSYVVSSNVTIIARFVKVHNLELQLSGLGRVNVDPPEGPYEAGSLVVLTAEPAPNWIFAGWERGSNSIANPLRLTMDGEKSLTARFLPKGTYRLSITIEGEGSVSLPSGEYTEGTELTLHADPKPLWQFWEWGGDLTSDLPTISFKLTNHLFVVARFVQGEPPRITQQPESTEVPLGGNAQFSVSASGTTPLSYQWFFNGSPLGNPSQTLARSPVRAGDEGDYWVVVSNQHGMLRSQTARLSIPGICSGDNVITVCNEEELHQAIQRGGVIRFCCSGVVSLTKTLVVTNVIALDATGRDVVIDGRNVVRLVEVSATGVFSATNVNFVNGYHEGRPGIDAKDGAPPVAGTPGRGGAMLNSGGRIALFSCVLSNNHVMGGKGPVDPSLSPVSLPDPGSLPGNGEGGAIFNHGGTLFIQNSRLSRNTARDGFPGAESSNLPFLYVSARGLGGAIYNGGGGALTLQGTEFVGNSTDCDWGLGGSVGGGALYVEDGSVQIVGGAFVDNRVEPGTEIADADRGIRPRPAFGGAIYVQGGTLVLENVHLTNNVSRGSQGFRHARPGESQGGALFAQGFCRIVNSTFWGNQAIAGGGSSVNPDGRGGAIFSTSNLVVIGSTFVSNTSSGQSGGSWGSPGASWPPGHAYGGAVYNTGFAAMTNCTLTENIARGGSREGFYSSNTFAGNAFGGAIYNASNTLWLMNVTLASNKVVSPNREGEQAGSVLGANLFNLNGSTMHIRNSILAGGGTNQNAEGKLIDEGFNMSSDGSAAFSSGTSFNFTDSLLMTLADNGGFTWTMALKPESPAIDFGGSEGALAVDQRGFSRPVPGEVDMGAYEFGAVRVSPSLQIAHAPGSIWLSFEALDNVRYTLQRSDDLEEWHELELIGPISGSTIVLREIPIQLDQHQFFRIHQAQP